MDYCTSRGLDPNSSLATDVKWRNAKCHVQTAWAHLHNRRDVLVTSDKRFHGKKADLNALGIGRVEYPREAAALI